LSCPDEELRAYFAPKSKEYCHLSLMDERIRMMRIAARVLIESYQGDFKNVILKAKNSAQKLIEIILHEFGPLFNDCVVYQQRTVYFQKRIQILVADIWACYENTG
jgi:hypothetical protein